MARTVSVPEEEPVRRRTPANFTSHSFTTPRGVRLMARVWPADPPVLVPAPVAVYTHGGAWTGGNHYAPLPWIEAGLRRRGWHIVSHNYRLAPQASMDMQVEDCVEAVQWVLENLGRVLDGAGAGTVDVRRLMLIGESAGAMLTANVALRIKSPPAAAVVLVYGALDLLALPGVWTDEDEAVEQAVIEEGEDASLSQQASSWTGTHGPDELKVYLSNRDPAQILCDAVFWDELDLFTAEQLRALWRLDAAWDITPRLRLQADLNLYRTLRDTAADSRKVWLHAERFRTRDEVREFVRSVSVADQVARAHTFPPTAFLHGGADTVTPQTQSEKVAGLLRAKGVHVLESYEAGQAHSFDEKYTGPDVPGWDLYIEPILRFLNEHARQQENFGPQDV